MMALLDTTGLEELGTEAAAFATPSPAYGVIGSLGLPDRVAPLHVPLMKVVKSDGAP